MLDVIRGSEVGMNSSKSVELARMATDKRRFRMLVLMIILTVVLSLVSLCLGRYSLSLEDIIKILLSPIFPIERTWTDIMENVVLKVRLPRMIAALLVGAALSLSGATYQGIFKNPLVSPDLLGVSSGSCVGAALAILMGLGDVEIQLFALVFGLVAVFIATAIPKMMRNSSSLMLVLSGVIVSGFMISTIGLLKYIADPETQLAAITYWQLGSISSVKADDVIAVFPAMFVAMIILIVIRWRINIISLGENEASLLGTNIKVIRGCAIVCSTVLTGCAVCISGTVGWVGLIIPHMCRMIVGPDNSKVMPISVFLGASFMLVVDTLARTVTAAEVPLSVITGFIGAPLFAWLLFKQRMKLR